MLLGIRDLPRLAEDLRQAHAVQSALLPSRLPSDGDLEVAASTVASLVVGGDFYDCVELDGARVAVAVGDAAGKGVPAALLAAQVQALWQASIAGGLARTLSALNAHLLRLGAARRCVTLFTAVLDRRSGRLDYASAGHNPPLVARADGSCEALTRADMLLGAFPGVEYMTASIVLEPGDALLLYTDGVTEAWRADGEMFGERRLQDVLLPRRAAGAAAIVEAVESEVRAFASSGDVQDDRTIVAVQIGRGSLRCS
jgi:sigma-B regulation protein RsbU (phosphoserine phosphatase)